MLEFLVHLSWPHFPPDIHIATLKIPDDLLPERLSANQLLKNWRHHPSPDKLANLGVDWARSTRNLLLRVSSAVVDQIENFLLIVRMQDW